MKRNLLLFLAWCAGSLSILAQPVITVQPTNQSAVIGSGTAFGVVATGIGPFTYQWQLNGTNLPNNNNIITRVAGVTSQAGFGGDGGLAINAIFLRTSGVAVDAAGNLFIVDQWNNRIRRVDTNGIINTVAGVGPNSSSGNYSGDGGAATNANLNLFALDTPVGVALDPTGNIYIADIGNNRIRKVDTNGTISTLAGTNSSGFSGDGGYAVTAKLTFPSSVTVDGSGNIYFADTGNNRVRKISVNGIISTVAGTFTLGFSGDGGPATNAAFNRPYGIAVDANGNLFIADHGNNCIRKVDANGVISTLAGNGTAGYGGDNGPATNALLNQPYSVAVDAYGDVFIADYSNSCVRMVDATGNIRTVAGTGPTGTVYSGDGGAATNASLYEPTAVGLDSYGNIFVGGNYYRVVRKVDLGRVPTLQLTNLVSSNAGNYDVIVTSPYGSISSSNALLSLLYPPSITTQPINAKSLYGSSASFSVIASGNAPFSYQWFTSSGRKATAVPVISAGSILSASITSGGAGYSSVPKVHFIGGSGVGAAATAVVNNGMVTAINIASQGFLYFSVPPTIQIDAPSNTLSTALVDQTNTSLNLPIITIENATNYFVVVTNNFGSVTSTVVGVTLFLPPQNFTAKLLMTGLQMQFTGTPYYPYLLQYATNLTPPISWFPVTNSPADTNGNWQYTDTNPKAAQKFYRVLAQ